MPAENNNVLLVNNTGVDIRMFENALRAAANGTPLADEIADMFSLKILDRAWSVGDANGNIRAIVDFA